MNGNFKQRESTEILKPGSGDTGFGGHYTQFTVFGGHYAQFTGRNYVWGSGDTMLNSRGGIMYGVPGTPNTGHPIPYGVPGTHPEPD
jgi:hypothetical protein